MLLRALQIHARISAQQMASGESGGDASTTLSGLQEDGYIGLYVSCTRLLDGLGRPSGEFQQPYTRLYLAYTREALRAARHLREVDSTAVPPLYWRALADAVSDYVAGAEDLGGLTSDLALERKLLEMLVSLDRGEEGFSLSANPAIVFPHLAEAVTRCASIWTNASVLFLLDDVSTRHLKQESIADLLSTLLFSNPAYAFKMTTEVQTLELLLRSPGLIETARAGRDYETFDLAAAVNERLRNRGGVQFISQILQHRAEQLGAHPSFTPRQLLGDASLESIGRMIVSTNRSSREKGSVYHGIRAIAAVCVGDIGDVLSIYESIVRRFDGSHLPIPETLQSECFQEYCSRRLYHLNRRGDHLKTFALSFAEASHELLIKSARDARKGGRKRLRQYSTLYIRLTSGDTEAQFEQLLELTDAGVFVLEGGSDAPRTKSRASKPIRQFILTYRKLFGLSSYIGLAESDRFELSGQDLQDWLDDPGNGKVILTRNLGAKLPTRRATKDEVENGATETGVVNDRRSGETPEGQPDTRQTHHQLPLVEQGTPDLQSDQTIGAVQGRLPEVRSLEAVDIQSLGVKTVVVGLGFEKRTLASATRLLDATTPNNMVLIRYQEKGNSDDIERLCKRRIKDQGRVHTIDYNKVGRSPMVLPEGPVVVDITGLAKPVLFRAVLDSLSRDGSVVVAHTDAEAHYPLNEEIEKILNGGSNGAAYEALEAAGKIWSGELKPYSFDKLISSDADESRRRLLCAAASPKHERLLSLLDERSFDHVDIVAPVSDTPRSVLARLAADVAARGLESSAIERIDSNDLEGMLEFMGRRFSELYVSSGFDVELALTGSKMHAVACAAACAVFKAAQCWYVRPRSFDPQRFSIGVGDTRFFELKLPNHPL